jgi:hypothetical protein
MSAIRSQAEAQAQLGEGPGCAKSGHSLSLQRTTAPSPNATFVNSAALDTMGGELPFAAECTKVGCADKPVIRPKHSDDWS